MYDFALTPSFPLGAYVLYGWSLMCLTYNFGALIRCKSLHIIYLFQLKLLGALQRGLTLNHESRSSVF